MSEGVRRGKGRWVFALRGGTQQGDMSIFGRSLPLHTMASVGSLPRAGCVGMGKASVAHAVGRAACLASLISMTLIK